MINIRNMTNEDYEVLKDHLNEYDDFWNANILKSELDNELSKYIVAEDEDGIVGFAGITFTPVDTEIMNIVTKKARRSQGIGTKMMEKLIEMTKEANIEAISLEVSEINIPAINLYKKFNFEEVGIRKKYYNGIDNAIIMTLKV